MRTPGSIRALLLQGITPERLALSLALGLIVGVVPVIGSVFVLATALAGLLRLNLVAIHLVTWLAYPFQFLLLIPFVRLGELLFAADRAPLSMAAIASAAAQGVWPAATLLGRSTTHALAAWAITAVVALPLLYIAILWVVRRTWRSTGIGAAPVHAEVGG